MNPADHIKEIKAAIRKINKEGHIAQADQYIAMSDLRICVNSLNDVFESLEGAALKLQKTIEWHKVINDTAVPPISGEVTAGEEVTENESEE